MKRLAAPLLLASVLSLAASCWASEPVMRMECSPQRPEVTFLSWDTEGGPRAQANLLRSGKTLSLRLRIAGQWKPASAFPCRVEQGKAATVYHVGIAPEAELRWEVQPACLAISVQGTKQELVEGLEVLFPFDPKVTPTTVVPAAWEADGGLQLPAVINAPDFGQIVLADGDGQRWKGRLEGSRADKIVDFVVEVSPRKPSRLTLTPLRLDAPNGLTDRVLWEKARRGWFGAFQPSARWGEQNRPFSAPAGILANNVISDPASCSLWFYADQALWTPQLTPEISIAAGVRNSIDWWLDHRTRSTGEVVCYWDFGNFLDANAGPLIAAWDYVEATGDQAWLRPRIERLEFIAEFLAKRDVDGDGMVEATQSGDRGTLQQPARSCAWFDALNCGYKDGYTNALIYRGWRCLAELEGQLGRAEKQARFTQLADRLKAAYAKTLYNPQTGWLAWWKSRDGELHDYATPIVNGLAIEYGLVDPAQGREILARLWAKIDQAGFRRFDLGIPPMLVPVHRSDYLLPEALGLPTKEDGTDTFGHYQNGGITAGQVLHFLAAHYVVGQPEKADMVLRAMLDRQAKGMFQNGVKDAGNQGIDWTDWNGNATGYEGYLADSFRFLQAVLLREPAFRARYYRPFSAPRP